VVACVTFECATVPSEQVKLIVSVRDTRNDDAALLLLLLGVQGPEAVHKQ
jgi:hypothetical protein